MVCYSQFPSNTRFYFSSFSIATYFWLCRCSFSRLRFERTFVVGEKEINKKNGDESFEIQPKSRN